MDADIIAALRSDRTVDITTTGRLSGKPRRTEIWFHSVGDAIYLTGSPGARDWHANLVANPRLMFHLKESATADLPASALAVTDTAERRAILREVTNRLGFPELIDAWLAGSPLVKILFDGGDQAAMSSRTQRSPDSPSAVDPPNTKRLDPRAADA